MTDDATLAAILTISALVPFSERGMAIYEIDGVAPQLAASAWVAASAQVMGRVLLGADASVWLGAVIRGDTESITVGAGSKIPDASRLHVDHGKPLFFGAVIRGDTESITVGAGSNIQDACVLHPARGKPLFVGERVTVGHQVVLHGCTIGDESLIGIGAVVLNGAKIGRNCLVGAGALVTEGREFPDGSMIIGCPAQAVRALTPEQIEGLRQSAQHYIDNARRFQSNLHAIG